MFANTCRHRGHELLPEDGTSTKRADQLPLPRVDLRPVRPAQGCARLPRGRLASSTAEHGLVELPLEVWHGWVFGHALHPVGAPEVPAFERYVGDLARMLAPYDIGSLVRRRPAHLRGRRELEGDRRELPRVLPLPADPPRAVPGHAAGLRRQLRPARRLDRRAMVLRDGMATMSLTGALAATPLPGVEPDRGGVPPPAAQPARLRAPRLRDDPPDGAAGAGPDLGGVLVAHAARRTRAAGAPGAVEFWDITNRQDWAACESVQRGLESPHFRPGPFAPREDAVAQLVSMIGAAYRSGGLSV